MALDGMEKPLHPGIPSAKMEISIKLRFNPEKVYLVRYVDDFVVSATLRETAKDIGNYSGT